MTTRIAFVKMHGAGNDFVVIDDREIRFPVERDLVAALCAAHTGIGADGLILVREADEADFRMRYFNRDGGEAGMCGNGARCVARFARDAGIAGDRMRFETGAGPVDAWIAGDDRVRIGMGPVVGIGIGLRPAGGWEKAHFADSGVPHAVVFADDEAALVDGSFLEKAPLLRSDPLFGEAGANVDLVFVSDPSTISFRTWERGVEAETLACGTGAVASAVVAAAVGLAAPPVSCRTAGGDVLEVDFALGGDEARDVFLTGPAVAAFSGEFDLDAYGSRANAD